MPLGQTFHICAWKMSQLGFLPNKTGILLLDYLLIHIVFHPGHWPVKEDLKLGNKLFDLLIYKLLTCVHIAHILLPASQTNYTCICMFEGLESAIILELVPTLRKLTDQQNSHL
jgi:hypothetical protein